MSIDLKKVRSEIPDVDSVDTSTHLNNAGASPSPSPVLEAVVSYLHKEAKVGGYRLQVEQAESVERYRAAAAELLDCQADEIAFSPSATQAWWSAFHTVALKPGDRVLITSAEYYSNILALIGLRDQGIQVELIPDKANTGMCDVDAMASMMDERVKLVCVTHVPTSGGLVNPAEEIGAVLAKWPALYLLDACQSVGQRRVSVADIGCDFLAVTGRKYLRAPRGTGLLYVRSGLEGLRDPAMLDLVSAEWSGPWEYRVSGGARRYENFETSIAAKVGLGVALDYALEIGMEDIEQRVKELAAELRSVLDELTHVEVMDLEGPQSGLVTFRVDGASPESIKEDLANQRINVSVVLPTHPEFDQTGRGVDGLVRASVHYFNTSEELQRLATVIAERVR